MRRSIPSMDLCTTCPSRLTKPNLSCRRQCLHNPCIVLPLSILAASNRCHSLLALLAWRFRRLALACAMDALPCEAAYVDVLLRDPCGVWPLNIEQPIYFLISDQNVNMKQSALTTTAIRQGRSALQRYSTAQCNAAKLSDSPAHSTGRGTIEAPDD